MICSLSLFPVYLKVTAVLQTRQTGRLTFGLLFVRAHDFSIMGQNTNLASQHRLLGAFLQMGARDGLIGGVLFSVLAAGAALAFHQKPDLVLDNESVGGWRGERWGGILEMWILQT